MRLAGLLIGVTFLALLVLRGPPRLPWGESPRAAPCPTPEPTPTIIIIAGPGGGNVKIDTE